MISLRRKRRGKVWQGSIFSSRRLSFRRRKNNFARTFKKIVALGFVFFVVYFIFFSRFFLIEKIIVEGNETIPSIDIENVVREEISKPVLGFLPSNNIFFYSGGKIKAALANRFSRIRSVEIGRIFPRGIKVKIEEKEPALIWCRLGDCYYLDREGVVFSRADYKYKRDGSRMIKVIEQSIIEEELEDESAVRKEREARDGVRSGEVENDIIRSEERGGSGQNYPGAKSETKAEGVLDPIKLGEKVSDEDFINFALKVDEEIKRTSVLKVKYYKTKGTKTRELIAYTAENLRLYFNTTDDPKLQVKYLNDFLSKGIDKKKISSLQYIYLEAGNKIFYK